MLAIPLCDALVPPSFAPRAVTWAPVGHPSPMHMRSTAEVRCNGTPSILSVHPQDTQRPVHLCSIGLDFVLPNSLITRGPGDR